MEHTRFYDMDWVRVLAFLLLMFYHTGMIFVGWDFEYPSKETLPILAPLMILMNQWRLPLLFAVSGAGTWFALRKRSTLRFAGERTLRLFLPLVFGMLFIIPPQIYVERVAHGAVYDSYWAFQQTVFALVPYPDGGSLSWHHLWFVVYLFVFSLVSLPLLAFLKKDQGRRGLERLRTWLAHHPIRLMVPALPLIAVHIFLDRTWPETHGLFDDPAALVRYFLLFWAGLIYLGAPQIRNKVRDNRHFFLVAAALAFTTQRFMIYRLDHELPAFYELYMVCRGTYCWAAILGISGYAARYLNRNNRFLAYANEAVYPYYILHQSVMLVLAHFILPLSWTPQLKFGVILAGMFLGSGLLYELVIRRFRWIRPLFGLKSQKRPAGMSPLQSNTEGPCHIFRNGSPTY